MLKGLKEEKVALILQTQKLQSLIPLDPILWMTNYSNNEWRIVSWWHIIKASFMNNLLQTQFFFTWVP
jgi:hypothetical protein